MSRSISAADIPVTLLSYSERMTIIPLGKRGKTPRKRARKRERERTRNKNTNVFGYVDVYEHEHEHVHGSEPTIKLPVGFASLP